jgi:signal transduction histidine kinase
MTPEEERLDASELTAARRQVIVSALVAFFGNISGAVLTSALYGGGLGNWLRYGHAALSIVVCVLARVRPPSRKLYLRLFAIQVVPIMPLLVVWTLAVPENHLSESFIAFKMVLMGVALLAPLSLTLGLVLLIGFSIETVAMWALHLAGNMPGEPWVTLFYAVFAIALLVQRSSERRLTRELTQANAEASALERIARSSLEVRDRMNTPLQTLVLSIELLGRRPGTDDADTRQILDCMRRAVQKLTELSRKLAEDEPSHPPPPDQKQ